jgi:hypothetical protein
VTPWSKKHPDGGSASAQRTDSVTCNATPSAQVVPLAPVAVFSRRHPGGLPFQSLDPAPSAGNVLMIHDHNRLAIRPDFFHPITAGIVGDLDHFVD